MTIEDQDHRRRVGKIDAEDAARGDVIFRRAGHSRAKYMGLVTSTVEKNMVKFSEVVATNRYFFRRRGHVLGKRSGD